jgi:4-hydroxy-3-polyprenylbenzoate decarboxylase
MTRYFLGLTGASGHAYAMELLRQLVLLGHEVDLSITAAGCKVLRHEQGLDPGERGERLRQALDPLLQPILKKRETSAVRAFPCDAIEAPPSSGTALRGGVLIVPCSMGTLARIAVGFSSNLVERAADVALKEGRALVLVPREAPLSEIHLENMLSLARRGAVILPASPGFYHRPRSVEDLVRHIVGKILDRIGLEHGVLERWKGTEEPAPEEGIGRPGSSSPEGGGD